MSDALTWIGCGLQLLGLGALFKVALAIKVYLRRPVLVPTRVARERDQALPVRAVKGWWRLKAHVQQIDDDLWALRQHLADVEWDLESRWGKDIDETRRLLEDFFWRELDALRTATIGKREGLNVYRLLVASVLLVAIGVVLQTIATLIA